MSRMSVNPTFAWLGAPFSCAPAELRHKQRASALQRQLVVVQGVSYPVHVETATCHAQISGATLPGQLTA